MPLIHQESVNLLYNVNFLPQRACILCGMHELLLERHTILLFTGVQKLRRVSRAGGN